MLLDYHDTTPPYDGESWIRCRMIYLWSQPFWRRINFNQSPAAPVVITLVLEIYCKFRASRSLWFLLTDRQTNNSNLWPLIKELGGIAMYQTPLEKGSGCWIFAEEHEVPFSQPKSHGLWYARQSSPHVFDNHLDRNKCPIFVAIWPAQACSLAAPNCEIISNGTTDTTPFS